MDNDSVFFKGEFKWVTYDVINESDVNSIQKRYWKGFYIKSWSLIFKKITCPALRTWTRTGKN